MSSDQLDRLRAALAGAYNLDREIGAGGMANVYLAEDVRHKRKVAVKVLKPELASTIGPERFLREIQIAAKLTHSHIVPLYDSGKATAVTADEAGAEGGTSVETFLYYVMPFMEGESLRQRLNREKRLDVHTVLEGSGRRLEGQVRVVVQLIDASNEAHLWVERYDCHLTDIFGIQVEIAKQVASALQSELSPHERARMTDRRAPEAQAYNLQLLGRFHADKWSHDGWQRAETYLRQAIDADSGYAAPHATLARNYAVRAYTHVMRPKEAFTKAEEHARTALALDANDSDAHMALAMVAYWFHWDWNLAHREFEQAIALAPGNSTAHTFLGSVLDTLGRHDAAMVERRRGYELDPLNPTANFNLAYGYLCGRHFAEAIAQFERSLELDPTSAAAIYGLGIAQVDGGDPGAGCQTFERGLEVERGSTMNGFLGWAYGCAGRYREAEDVLARLLGTLENRRRFPLDRTSDCR